MATDYKPLAGESYLERAKADRQDRFIRDAVNATNSLETWAEFLNSHPEYKGFDYLKSYQGRYEVLRSKKWDAYISRREYQNDVEAELQRVRSKRYAEYDARNKEARFQEVQDDFLRFAYENKSWSEVEKSMDEVTPWDESIYQACRKEVETDTETPAPDMEQKYFTEGFYS